MRLWGPWGFPGNASSATGYRGFPLPEPGPWAPEPGLWVRFPASRLHFLDSDLRFLASVLNFLAPSHIMNNFMCDQNIIYDIGTKILNLQCFNFPQNQLFCKSIIFRRICSIFCALSDGSIKT